MGELYIAGFLQDYACSTPPPLGGLLKGQHQRRSLKLNQAPLYMGAARMHPFCAYLGGAVEEPYAARVVEAPHPGTGSDM